MRLLKLAFQNLSFHFCFAVVKFLQNADSMFRAILWAWKYFLP